METREHFRDVVAQFLGVEPSTLGPDFSVQNQLKNSITRAKLQARLRKELGLMSLPLANLATYQQLESVCLGSVALPITGASTSVTTDISEIPPGISCGIDLQHADELPSSADYWEETFYRETFSPDEIAECVSRENPREHFAARWAAKEALIKCDRRWSDVPLAHIEIRKDEDGRPILFDRRGTSAREIGARVSLSHTGGLAAAVVVSGGFTHAFSCPSPPPPTDIVASPAAVNKGTGAKLALLLAGLSLIFALAAFFR